MRKIGWQQNISQRKRIEEKEDLNNRDGQTFQILEPFGFQML